MGETSPWHWLIVIAVALLLFGARRLPDAARSLGRSARILKAELRDGPVADTSPDRVAAPPRDGSGTTGSERAGEHPRPAEGPTAP